MPEKASEQKNYKRQTGKLDDDKSVTPSRTQSHPKHVCTKWQTCKTCGTKTDKLKEDKAMIRDFNNPLSTTDRRTRQ